jgi:hypothetical protein
VVPDDQENLALYPNISAGYKEVVVHQQRTNIAEKKIANLLSEEMVTFPQRIKGVSRDHSRYRVV